MINMAELRPFGALRFTAEAGNLAALVCPPYDIISEEERREYLEENPRNIIRLELPREGDDPYAVAGETMEQWIRDNMLATDDAPALYIYEELFRSKGRDYSIKGIVGRVRLEEWEKGVVLPHEETLSKAKADRLNLMRATNANLSSIYSFYFDGESGIYQKVIEASMGEPDVSFTTPKFDGITHRVWIVTDPAAIEAITGRFADKKLYIADGHHRYETAVNYRNELREKGEITDENHPANFVIMTLVHVEHPGLVVYPTHRIVRDLAGFDEDKLLTLCQRYFDIEEIGQQEALDKLEEAAALGKKTIAFCGSTTQLLTIRDRSLMDELLPGASEAYRGLDVNILHVLILERLLGIDKENMKNQKNLTYTRDPAEAIEAVESGGANCAFLINATRVDEIAAVAGAGEKMPQKSTYFYPKLVTGHVMNRLTKK
jgi:uncharacterized protein (DUF1015 family)